MLPKYVRAKQTNKQGTKQINCAISKGHGRQHEKAAVVLNRNNLSK